MFYGNNNKEIQKHIVLSPPRSIFLRKNYNRFVLLIFISRFQNTLAVEMPLVFRTKLNLPWRFLNTSTELMERCGFLLGLT